MGKFLTDSVRLEQTKKTRIFRTLDNELYKDDDGTIYIVPRYFQTDNYTIPLIVSFIGGSPVDYPVECSHLHDEMCYFWKAVYVTLTEEELREKGYYRYSEHREMWVCDDIPQEFLAVKTVSKFQANNLLYRTMKASNVPFSKRALVRTGVALNLMWYLRKTVNWLSCHKLFPRLTAFLLNIVDKIEPLDLNRFYDKDFWDFVGTH